MNSVKVTHETVSVLVKTCRFVPACWLLLLVRWLKRQHIWLLQVEKLSVFICMQSGEVRSDREWSRIMMPRMNSSTKSCPPVTESFRVDVNDRCVQSQGRNAWGYTFTSSSRLDAVSSGTLLH